MASHCSILAWKILWTEEPGRLQFVGSQRVRHSWAAEHRLQGALAFQIVRPGGSSCQYSSYIHSYVWLCQFWNCLKCLNIYYCCCYLAFKLCPTLCGHSPGRASPSALGCGSFCPIPMFPSSKQDCKLAYSFFLVQSTCLGRGKPPVFAEWVSLLLCIKRHFLLIALSLHHLHSKGYPFGYCEQVHSGLRHSFRHRTFPLPLWPF